MSEKSKGLSVRYTHQEFLGKIPKQILDKITIIGTYEGRTHRVLIDTECGLCNPPAYSLMNGVEPSIKTAVDKSAYFLNLLKHKNKKVLEDIVIVGEYIQKDIPIEVYSLKYGRCKVIPNNLLRGQSIDVGSCCDKKEYWQKEFKRIHSDSYEYIDSDYEYSHSKIKINCKKHGEFEQTVRNHLAGRGCHECAYLKTAEFQKESPSGWDYKEWEAAAGVSKNFDSFKVYVIKCWNEKEIFYKIGKTFKKIDKRFSSKASMPYSYEIVSIVDCKKALEASRLEHVYKRENKKFKYTPIIRFDGMYECFYKIKV